MEIYFNYLEIPRYFTQKIFYWKFYAKQIGRTYDKDSCPNIFTSAFCDFKKLEAIQLFKHGGRS